eukprot:TRINITY_DN3240_c0_g1_i1.p1 TRINITY_DN3240_c0_g1~~TRINITY_DN3240_c0_g1_i1.p1  ORF type:complete len:169 (-),score=29.24 TRINITY_DN3240_c0_g1_i1:50-556(-)
MTTISFALQVLVCVSLIGSSLELTYPKNKYVLVNNTLELYWEIVDQNITFALKLNSTKGWAGVGIGSSMTGADIITMELINGQIIINDRYSSGRGLPPLDTSRGGSNSVTLLESDITGGFIQARFTRNLNTTDASDVVITQAPTNFIYAYGLGAVSYTHLTLPTIYSV